MEFSSTKSNNLTIYIKNLPKKYVNYNLHYFLPFKIYFENHPLPGNAQSNDLFISFLVK